MSELRMAELEGIIFSLEVELAEAERELGDLRSSPDSEEE